MSSGRSNKPLFEVLSQHPPRGINPPTSAGAPPVRGEPAKAEPANPAGSSEGRTSEGRTSEGRTSVARSPEAVQAEPKPRAVPGTTHRPPTGSPTSRPEASRPTRAPETLPREGSEELDEVADAPPRPVVTIPLSTVYSAIALMGALIFIAWIAGHTVGANNKQAELTRGVQPPAMLNEPSDGVGNAFDDSARNPGTSPGQIQDPTRGTLQNPPDAAGPAVGPATTPANPAVSPGVQPSANGTILSAAGMLEVDPREAGLNYLELGTFRREMAQSAIDYLGANGVPVIGLPQPGGQYRLVSVGLGVPGSQFSAMASQRTAHKRTIAEIGTRWVREQQGGSDFSTGQTQWTKYQP